MKEMEQEKEYAYWLDNIKGIGHKTAIKLMDYYKSPSAIYEAPQKELCTMMTEKMVRELERSKKFWNVQKEYAKLRKDEILFYHFTEPEFPKKLREIPDMPFGIYVKGKLPDVSKKSVAIIGARECTNYGIYVAQQFAKTLAQYEVQIISGMARGIDSISQKAAIENGGTSFAVLGSGVQICYPQSCLPLYRKLIKEGGVISTYPPMTEAKPQLFPPRNRIISGLADVILVIEGSMKSGTLITVDMALEQGKEVYVIPGRITDKTSQGCNYLIKQGANSIMSPEDLLDELGINKKDTKEKRADIQLSEEEGIIYQILDHNPMSIEQISHQVSEISVVRVMELLVLLCGKNKAQCVEGNSYVKAW